MSFIGIKGAERLDGSNPTLGLVSSQQEAVAMLRKGDAMQLIKQATGWETGVDGKWRYEIADPFHTTIEIEDHLKRHFGEPLDICHCMKETSLLIAYPAFSRLRLFALYSPTQRIAGYFDSINYGMVVCMGRTSSPFEYQTEGVLLHEVQHLIQEEENFARGGSASEGRNIYQRLAGEVEACNVCHRHTLTSEERRTTLRTATQDVPDNKQIIRIW